MTEFDYEKAKAGKRVCTRDGNPAKIIYWNKKDDWIAVVGMYENKPYEIFTGRAEYLTIPKNIDNGEIIRIKEQGQEHARYDFLYKDNDGNDCVCEGLSKMFNKEYWNYAKLISGILRQGMPIPNVVDLISKLNL